MTGGSTGVSGLRDHVGRLLRYAGVSVVCVLLTMLGLACLVGVLGVPAGWANFFIVTAAIPLVVVLNRRWVWSRAHGGWPKRELLTFAIFALAGLALSTLSVHYAGQATARWPRSRRLVIVELANLLAFGTLWITEYVVIDRWLWAPSPVPGQDARVEQPVRSAQPSCSTSA